MTQEMTKKELRAHYLNRRQAITQEVHYELSVKICTVVSEWLDSLQVNQVLMFIPINSEPSIDLLSEMLPGIIFGIPRIEGKRVMRFYRWKKNDRLCLNKWNISEPNPETSRIVDPNDKTAAIVPCLAVDTSGYRLGYGGGYYDSYLSKYDSLTTVAVCFNEFFVQRLPCESWDIPVQFVSNENGLYKI